MRLSTIAFLAVGAALCARAACQGGVPPTWRPTPLLATPVRGVEIAYDAERERIVMFGGSAGVLNTQGSYAEEYLDNTWEWDGSQWWLKDPANRPQGREGHAMFFCPVRRKIILFGGVRLWNRSLLLHNDMWEWDGQDWLQLTPVTVPRTRSYMAYAADTARRRVVLFGGATGIGLLTTVGDLDDTWEWDGTTWTQFFPKTVPLKRGNSAMAFLPANGRCVMRGGGFYFDATTWEWDGQDWKGHLDPKPDPMGSMHHVYHDMATAPNGRSVVLAGRGSPFATARTKTFTWDGKLWSPVTTPTIFGNRNHDIQLTTDLARGLVVMREQYGGLHTRTLALQSPTPDWQVAEDSSMPGIVTAKIPSSVVHDPVHEEYLMLESWSPTHESQTWVLRGTEYVRLYPSRQPPYRTGSGMIWHPVLNQVFVYGGESDVGNFNNRTDTWLWNGSNWNEHVSATQPPVGGPGDARSPYGGPNQSIAYDSRRNRVVHFIAGETWEWEVNQGWQKAQPLVSPPWTRGVLCYDPMRGVTLMACLDWSTSYREEMWEYDGSTWVQRTPKTMPPQLTMRSLTFVPFFGGIVGIDQGFSSGSVSTWLWDGLDWSRVSTQRALVDNIPGCAGSPVYDSTRQVLRMVYSYSGSRVIPAELIWDLHFENLSLAESSPRIGQSLDFSIEVPSHAGKPWFLGLSSEVYPGIPFLPQSYGANEVFPLGPSLLLDISLASYLGGVLDSQGKGQYSLPIPLDPSLEHLRIHAAAIAFDFASLTNTLITNPVKAEIIR